MTLTGWQKLVRVRLSHAGPNRDRLLAPSVVQVSAFWTAFVQRPSTTTRSSSLAVAGRRPCRSLPSLVRPRRPLRAPWPSFGRTAVNCSTVMSSSPFDQSRINPFASPTSEEEEEVPPSFSPEA